MQIYLVGGAVRDSLLGIPVHERDWVVVGASPERLLELGYRAADPRFPVFLHPETGEEYALARRETKTGRGYKGFGVEYGPQVRLEEDLARRDLRVNAMARSGDGTLIDPFGGQDDLRARRLRHVTPAFVEDPLRILRAARFRATLGGLGFELDEETFALMGEMAQGPELGALSGARIWRETSRALASAAPGRYLDVLARCGALERLLPELAPARIQHAIARLEHAANVPGEPGTRMAATAALLAPDAPRELAMRLGAPERVLELCTLVQGWTAERIVETAASPEALMRSIEALDAIRRPERLERFVDALAPLAAGREDAVRALRSLTAARSAAAAVQARALAATGLEGRALGEALRARRVVAIADAATRGEDLDR